MNIEIGSIYWISVPYYDKNAGKDSFKYRPAFILHESDADEYNVLPVSRCNNTYYYNPEYDVPIKLKEKSYIRVHKQTTVHITKIGKKVCNVKNDFSSTYDEVIAKYQKYYNEIVKDFF